MTGAPANFLLSGSSRLRNSVQSRRWPRRDGATTKFLSGAEYQQEKSDNEPHGELPWDANFAHAITAT